MSRNQQSEQKPPAAQQKVGSSQMSTNSLKIQFVNQNNSKPYMKPGPKTISNTKNKLSVTTAATKAVAAASNVTLMAGAVTQSAQVQFQAKAKSGATTPGIRSLSQVSIGPNPATMPLGNTGGERLEVTVIPVDEEPYSKIVQIPHSLIGSSQHQNSGSSSFAAGVGNSAANTSNQYPSLKDIFQTSDTLWKNIFGSFVQANKQPLFSVFRKKIERKANSIISSIPANSTSELGLHILFLKCDGTKFPRNAYANSLEVYCSTYFYGPLVIVFGDTNPPYRLHDFPPYYLQEKIDPLNEEEQKFYPLPFSAKKDSLVRALMNERRFTIDLDDLERVLNLEEFMLYCYKTSFCPLINQKHEWSECNYAHRQQDFRRPPYGFFYMPEKCPAISEDGNWDGCEYYLECQYSHTLVETLFNPLHYKLKDCKDRTPSDKFSCAKLGDLCCHAHSQEERDLAQKALRNVPRKLPVYQIEEIIAMMRDYVDCLPDYMEVPSATTPLKKASSDSSSPEIVTNLPEAMPAVKPTPTTKEPMMPGKVNDFNVLSQALQVVPTVPQINLAMTNVPKAPLPGPADLNDASSRQWQKLQDMFKEAAIGAPQQSITPPVVQFKTPPIVTVKTNKVEKDPVLMYGKGAETSPLPMPSKNQPSPPQKQMPATKQTSQPMFVFDMPSEKKLPESIMEKIGASPSLSDEAGIGASKAIIAPGEKKTRGKLKKASKTKGMQYVMTSVGPSSSPSGESPMGNEEEEKKSECSPSPAEQWKNTSLSPTQEYQRYMECLEPSPLVPTNSYEERQRGIQQDKEERLTIQLAKEKADLSQNTKGRATSEQQQQKKIPAVPLKSAPAEARQPVHHQQEAPQKSKNEESKAKAISHEKVALTTTPPRNQSATLHEPSTATTTTRQTSSKASTLSNQQNGATSRSPEPVEQFVNKSNKQEVGRLKGQSGQDSSSRSSSQIQSTKKSDKKSAQKPPIQHQNTSNSNQKSIHSIESPRSGSNASRPLKIVPKKVSDKSVEEGRQSPYTDPGPSPTLSNSKSEQYESLQEQELRTLMMYAVEPKVQNEAGIALVDSHLNAQIQKEKLQMRQASRFAPDQSDKLSEEESSEEDRPTLNQPDDLSSPDSNIITIESVESPTTYSGEIRKNDKTKSPTGPFTYKKLPANMVGEIDSDFDPSKLVYVTPETSEEESKKRQPVSSKDSIQAASTATPSSTYNNSNSWKDSKQAPLKRSEQKKNKQAVASKPQRTFAQKQPGPTAPAAPPKTAAQVTPFVPKQHNNQQQQQQVRQKEAGSMYNNTLTQSPFKDHYSGQNPYKQQQQQEQNQNMMVVSSHNFAFGLPPTSPKTPPNVPTAPASELADTLMLERSSLAETPHNRQRGSGALRAASPQEPFNCALFPTLQQIVTVMPEDDDDPEEEKGKVEGSLLLGGDNGRTPAYGTGNAFSGRVGVGHLSWSFGSFEVPQSVKELWDDDDASLEDQHSSPTALETAFASSPELYSPQLRPDKDPNRFASQSPAQSQNFSRQASPESLIQNSAAIPQNEFDFINPYAFGQDKIE